MAKKRLRVRPSGTGKPSEVSGVKTLRIRKGFAAPGCSAFWSSFLVGMSGPGMMFYKQPKSGVSPDFAAVQSVWKGVGNYLDKGLMKEEANVRKNIPTRKAGKAVIRKDSKVS